jgi:Carboxypeptidase regulatory-like domain/TonB dependent receptor
VSATGRTRIVGYSLFCGALLLVQPSPLRAQIDQGAIRGTVQDPSGGVIPGAKVTLTNEETGLALETSSGGDGTYTFSPIKIGTYSVATTKEGFETVTVPHVAVHVNEQVKADVTLPPGQVTQRVEVTSALPVLQTQSSTVGQDLSSQQVNDLPLSGRNYTQLSQTAAGVTRMQSGRLSGTGLGGGGGGFTANGLAWSHNSYILDGIDNNNNTVDFLNGAAYVIVTPPDAIQEVNVQTSNFNAEYGRAGSAVMNATTKSGTNQYHGDLWEYFQNDKLNANNWNADRAGTGKSELRFNQFGFTFGGPVIIPKLYDGHNKTFFFGDYQGTRIAQTSFHNPSVPTAAERNSGFTNFQDLITTQKGTFSDNLGRTLPQGAILDPATTRAVTAGQVDPVTGIVATKTGYVRDPFFQGNVAGVTNFATAGNESLMNILPLNRLDPNAIKLLRAYPAPNTAGSNGGRTNNFGELLPLPDDTNQFDVRVDHNFSERDQMFARAGYAGRTRFVPGDFSGAIDNSGFGSGNFIDHSVNAALSETHLFSPTLINEARIGYSRLTDFAEPPVANETGIPQQFGIQGVPQSPGLGGLPYLNISGLTGIGPGEFASPNTRVSDTRQITENLTKIRGGHTFKGGFEAQFLRFSFDNPRDPRGRMDFSTNYTGIPGTSNLGSGMADLLLMPAPTSVPNGVSYLGGPNQFWANSLNAPDDVRHYYGAYLQDDWKLTPKLTLNLGVRWEYFGTLRNKYNDESNFQPAPWGQPGSAWVITGQNRNLPLSPAFVNQLAKDGIALEYSAVPGLFNPPVDDFAPRVGFAYQLTQKLVMRASYGIFYAGFENLGGSPDPSTNYPFGVQPTVSDSSNGVQTVGAQYPGVFKGTIPTLENALTFVTPSATSPAFNPKGMSFESFATPWKTGSTQEWNFTLQYALTHNDSVQVGYVGNHSVHQINGWRVNNINEILPPGTTTQNYVPFPDFAQGNDYIASNGDAYYYGFQVTYQRRFASGVSILANFTHSRCMTDFRNILNDDTPNGNQRAPYLPGFGLKGDYTFCADDSPEVLHFSGTWAIPYGRGRQFGAHVNGFVDAILGGWSTNWVVTSQSGFPGNVGCPASTTAGFGCVAFLVPGQSMYLNAGPHGTSEFLNPAAFAQPPIATTIGQTDYRPLGGRASQFHGPAFNDVDFSLFKQFHVNERTYFEFRGEFFNILNHPNFGVNSFATLNFQNANFSQITGTVQNAIARETQLALKLYW